MREIRRQRDEGNKREARRNEWEVFNMYGTNGWDEIAEMYVSDHNPGAPLEDMGISSASFWRSLQYDRPRYKII